MSTLGTWMTVLLFIAGTATAAFVCVGVIDWFIDRITPTQAQKDVDDLFRRDRARDVMRSWQEPPPDPRTERQKWEDLDVWLKGQARRRGEPQPKPWGEPDYPEQTCQVCGGTGGHSAPSPSDPDRWDPCPYCQEVK